MSISTGPGLPERAMVKAWRSAPTMRSARSTRTDHLVIGRKICSCATSWLAPLCVVAVAPRPARMTIGSAPTKASAIPGTRLVAPGPAVTQQTPGSPGELRVARRHVGGDLLVPHQDVADLGRVVERVVDAERVAAGNPEHRLDALGLEHVDDGAACADFHFASRSAGFSDLGEPPMTGQIAESRTSDAVANVSPCGGVLPLKRRHGDQDRVRAFVT